MNILDQTAAHIETQIVAWEKKCWKVESKAAINLAFCGARCAEMLTELYQSGENSPGKMAVEGAAKQATAWPVAYPALADGRTNRIAEQVPAGLKDSLKFSTRVLRATGRRVEERPGVKTFLEHAMQHENLVRNESSKHSGLASIMGALIVLHRQCLKGSDPAAAIVAAVGVRCSKLLSELLDYPENSKQRKAAEAAALVSPEWPVSIQTRKDLHDINQSVPRCLGQGLGFCISKESGTKADRDFDPETRFGFAFTYFQDLMRARDLALRYDSHGAALAWELARQCRAAGSVLFDRQYLKSRFHVVPKVIDQLPESFWKYAANGISQIPAGCKEIVAITKKLLDVVPAGTSGIWRRLGELPDFNRDNLDTWVKAGVLLAQMRCGGKWANGPWPQILKDAANKRAKFDADSSHETAVRDWLSYGFDRLVDDL